MIQQPFPAGTAQRAPPRRLCPRTRQAVWPAPSPPPEADKGGPLEDTDHKVQAGRRLIQQKATHQDTGRQALMFPQGIDHSPALIGDTQLHHPPVRLPGGQDFPQPQRRTQLFHFLHGRLPLSIRPRSMPVDRFFHISTSYQRFFPWQACRAIVQPPLKTACCSPSTQPGTSGRGKGR